MCTSSIVPLTEFVKDKDTVLTKTEKKNVLKLAFDLYGKKGKESVAKCKTQHELDKVLHSLRLGTV
jgi:hypothetical protein